MDGVTFDNFDPSPYHKVPGATLFDTISLARALRENMPTDAPEPVEHRAKQLDEVIEVAEKELTGRRREDAEQEYGVPVVLDGGADGLWGLCYRSLQAPQIYLHAAFDPFIANPDSEFGQSLAQDRERGKRAAKMHQRLFGDEGLGFLNKTFRTQSEVTNSILRLITEDELIEPLSELVGASLVKQLFALQKYYEMMVVDQLTESATPKLLNKVRRRLARAIQQYNNAVLDMVEESQPETLEVVLTALEPMIILRDVLAAATTRKDEPGPGTGGAGGGDDVGGGAGAGGAAGSE